MDEAELDLREIFWMIRRRLWMILLMPLIAGLVAGVVSLFVIKPVFSASTTLWVIKDGGSQISYNDLLLNRNLTKTYAEVAKSRAVMTEVIVQLKLSGVTVDGLQKRLVVTPVRDTEILSFAVDDHDPLMAAQLADKIAEVFQQQIRTYMNVENVVVVDQAMVPTRPIKPRTLMNVAIAVVLGGMAALGLTFLLEYMDTSIKTPEDVAKHLGLPVLGVIPIIGPDDARGPNQPDNARTSSARMVIEK